MADEQELRRMQKLLEQMMGYTPTNPPHQGMNQEYMDALAARSPAEYKRVSEAYGRHKDALEQDKIRGATDYASYRSGVSAPQGMSQDWRNERYMSQLRDRDLNEWMRRIRDAYNQEFYGRGIEFAPQY